MLSICGSMYFQIVAGTWHRCTVVSPIILFLIGLPTKKCFSPACSNRLVEAFAWSESMSIPSLLIYPHFPLAFLKAETQKGNRSLTPQRFKGQFQFGGYYVTSCLVDRFCLCFCFRSIAQIWVMKFEHVGKHGYLPWNDPLSGGTISPGILLQKLFKLPNLGGSNNRNVS